MLAKNSGVCELLDLAIETVNAMGEKVEMRICSTPTEQAADIYSMLNYKKMLYRKIKICRTQSP